MKEAPGGLRDIVAARLLASLAHDPAAIDEDDLEQAENFLLRVRGILHLAARRNSNVLSHELQERVAERLRFPGADPQPARRSVDEPLLRPRPHGGAGARDGGGPRDAGARRRCRCRSARTSSSPAARSGSSMRRAPSAEPASWLGVFEAALEHGATVAPETLGAHGQPRQPLRARRSAAVTGGAASFPAAAAAAARALRDRSARCTTAGCSSA